MTLFLYCDAEYGGVAGMARSYVGTGACGQGTD